MSEVQKLIAERGNNPLFSFSLAELEPVFKTWISEVVNEGRADTDKPVLYDRKDIKEMFRCSYPKIIGLERRGVLRGSRIGNKYLYSLEQVQDALGGLKRPPSSPLN